MATSLPPYSDEWKYEVVLNRILTALPNNLDKSEGSLAWDLASTMAIELARAYEEMVVEMLNRTFASLTFGDYLDLRAEEHGIYRKPATKAIGEVEFSGTPGIAIPIGTRVSTSGDLVEESVDFQTTEAVTLDASSKALASIEATKAGAIGNVGAYTVNVLSDPVPGINSVTNLSATTGGLDEESDASLLERYLFKVQNPSSSGNKADYVNWSLEVTGVGGAKAIPLEDGPGTVSIYIIDSNKQPASQTLIDSVQDYIAPPYRQFHEEFNLITSGYGISTVSTADAGDGNAIEFLYDVLGTGNATHQQLNTILDKPGIWMVRPQFKVDNNLGANDLVEVGIWNLSTNDWCKTNEGGLVNSNQVLTASSLPISFDPYNVSNWPVNLHFYWNGDDQIELRITRLQSDASTKLYLDNVVYISTFSKVDGTGLAPIGSKLTTKAADAVVVNILVNLQYLPGYNVDSVKNAVISNLNSYIKSLAFTDDNDVKYVRIGQVILDTEGVYDYSDLLVNNSSSNISILDHEVAIIGTVTVG